jgi:mevalonate kinase
MTVYSAPAKIILFGEHAVVYGQPAIAIPVPALRAYAEVKPAPAGQGLRIHALDTDQDVSVSLLAQVDDALTHMAQLVLKHFNMSPPDITIELRSRIPIASGLGSGAAVSAALARALAGAGGQALATDTLNDLVYELEKRHHGTPSGIDNTVIVYEQPVYFVRNQPIERLDVAGVWHFVIGDTGQASLTKAAVAAVRALYDQDQPHIQPVLDKIGEVTSEARRALQTGDAASVGRLMAENHSLLQQLNVSSEQLDRLVAAAGDAGALGAKMSGGGRGGNMIALVSSRTRTRVAEALRAAGAVHVYETVLSGEEAEHRP